MKKLLLRLRLRRKLRRRLRLLNAGRPEELLARLLRTKEDTKMKYFYYQHQYNLKWYVLSENGKICKEFNTQKAAEEFISSTSNTPIFIDVR
jgi:hypothetical protein